VRASRLSRPFAGLAVVATLAFTILTWACARNLYLPFDVPVMHAIQSVDWRQFDPLFNFTLWLNGPRQQLAAFLVLALVALLHLRSLPFALVASLSGVGYVVTTELVRRPRPTASLVSVPAHVDGFGYPSGHASFFLTYTAILALCIGNRYLPKWASALLALVGLALWALASIQRMESGAHWPSDILGGTLLAIIFLALALSIRWLSDPVLRRKR
jgi:undecaprenyl-diphosphatase